MQGAALTIQRAAIFLPVFILLAGCQSTYYALWEQLGKEKRHLLRDQVVQQREDQQAASEQFTDALTRIKEIYGMDGGDLEAFYVSLRDDYEACQERAQAVDDRIARVERIAGDLFDEWSREIEEINNTAFKSKSRASLQATRQRYDRLAQSMDRAQSRMNAVIGQLNDYVLFLKHNLNARAMGVLKDEAAGIEADVASLIADIQASIREADDFITTLDPQKTG
jgi:hypothetical protein